MGFLITVWILYSGVWGGSVQSSVKRNDKIHNAQKCAPMIKPNKWKELACNCTTLTEVAVSAYDGGRPSLPKT